MRIAVPAHPFYAPLVARLQEQSAGTDTRIIQTTEEECTRLLLANSVELALLSPLGYGQGVVRSDFRIIPSTACLLRGWTNVVSILFAKNLGEVHNIVSPTAGDFLIRCAQLVLEEQYGIEAELKSAAGSASELLKSAESVLCWTRDAEELPGMDLSEEWEIAFAEPLPVAMWVCRSEYLFDAGAEQHLREEQLMTLTRSLASAELPDADIQHESAALADTEEREGVIEWKWTDAFERALEACLQLLYQRQLLAEIPAIKIVGRDEELSAS